jgi:hypothetical protein
MNDKIRELVSKELNNNETVTLPYLYNLLSTDIQDSSKTMIQMKHRVRSILDGYRIQGKLSRIAPLTYSKTVNVI